ncbi:hypothetical protein G6F64_014245 [Rhizopus arrhizus]|uniref:Uncharacterized protein n=1 Tax=Rhizopus oryzae TaxID=64495 RepID=A0A9P6WTX4_RHIOR|nr:hypothetical protein G6F64_014245 [Rhizopus arrhizus]
MHRVRDVGDDRRSQAGARLAHRGQHRLWPPACTLERQLRGHADGPDLFGHHTDLLLHGLEAADGLAELRPRVGVVQRQREYPVHGAGHQAGIGGGRQFVQRTAAAQALRIGQCPRGLAVHAAMHAVRFDLAGLRGQQPGLPVDVRQDVVRHADPRHVGAHHASALDRQAVRSDG